MYWIWAMYRQFYCHLTVCLLKTVFSMQSNAVNASTLSSNATSAATATLLPNTNLIANTINAGALDASSLVAFQRELERQSKQQSYEDKLNSLKQGIISAESKASLDSATASSAFYYANNKELSSSSNSSKAEFLKGKKLCTVKLILKILVLRV